MRSDGVEGRLEGMVQKWIRRRSRRDHAEIACEMIEGDSSSSTLPGLWWPPKSGESSTLEMEIIVTTLSSLIEIPHLQDIGQYCKDQMELISISLTCGASGYAKQMHSKASAKCSAVLDVAYINYDCLNEACQFYRSKGSLQCI